MKGKEIQPVVNYFSTIGWEYPCLGPKTYVHDSSVWGIDVTYINVPEANFLSNKNQMPSKCYQPAYIWGHGPQLSVSQHKGSKKDSGMNVGTCRC